MIFSFTCWLMIVFRTGGTPRDRSCCGIELQTQIAVHGFHVFRITASFVSYSCIFFGLHFRCLQFFQTKFPFLAEFLIPFDHLLLLYSTFNSEFCFMQRFVFSIYLILRYKETVQPNLNFSPFGTCKLMMFPFTHLKFTFHYFFFHLLNPEGWGKNIEDSLMQHTCSFIKG